MFARGKTKIIGVPWGIAMLNYQSYEKNNSMHGKTHYFYSHEFQLLWPFSIVLSIYKGYLSDKHTWQQKKHRHHFDVFEVSLTDHLDMYGYVASN